MRRPVRPVLPPDPFPGHGATPPRSTARRLLGGALAGTAGTAAMTTTGRLHRLVHARRRGIEPDRIRQILDYDDSEHVVIAAATLLRGVTGWAPSSERGRAVLFRAVHWGYGSAFGAAHAELHHRLGEPAAGITFFVGSQVMALSLFPVLGGTPVPWRWTRRLLVTSFAQHAVYAAAVAAAGTALAGRDRARGGRDGSYGSGDGTAGP